jgi:transcriptional regulator with XRE-family HTH domain
MARDRRGSRDVAVRFGENLRRHREAAGSTQEDLAFYASLHRTEIGLLERGQRVARIDTLVRLAAALSASPVDLLDGISWEPPLSPPPRGRWSAKGKLKLTPPEDRC